MTINGRRIRDVVADWQEGDFLADTFQVWQQHHMLSILLREGTSIPNSMEVEHTSFLQKNVIPLKNRKKDTEAGTAFYEVCVHLGCKDNRDKDSGEWVKETTQPVYGNNMAQNEPDGHTSNKRRQDEKHTRSKEENPKFYLDEINSLQFCLRHLLSRGEDGINKDFYVIPELHPHAFLAKDLVPTMPAEDTGQVYHIFTDGSCKGNRAIWAITILRQACRQGRDIFQRIGFAAGGVDESLGPCEQTAMDAEATAIIAMQSLPSVNAKIKGSAFSGTLKHKSFVLEQRGFSTSQRQQENHQKDK